MSVRFGPVYTVNWFAKSIPRSHFDQDLLYSFGAFLTICRIKRNDAEDRVRGMASNNWKSTLNYIATEWASAADTDNAEYYDIERAARDQIAKFIEINYRGHKMTELIDAILQARGFMTYRSPPGPDKGVDLLAAPGPLGFGQPRLCVQVKTGDTPIDRPTLDQLIGTMQNFSADQGLLVSWAGFKSSVDAETAPQFFRVRLWDQDSILDELLDIYDDLDKELQTELPIKRAWTLTMADQQEAP